jgi:hypothetical protein
VGGVMGGGGATDEEGGPTWWPEEGGGDEAMNEASTGSGGADAPFAWAALPPLDAVPPPAKPPQPLEWPASARPVPATMTAAYGDAYAKASARAGRAIGGRSASASASSVAAGAVGVPASDVEARSSKPPFRPSSALSGAPFSGGAGTGMSGRMTPRQRDKLAEDSADRLVAEAKARGNKGSSGVCGGEGRGEGEGNGERASLERVLAAPPSPAAGGGDGRFERSVSANDPEPWWRPRPSMATKMSDLEPGGLTHHAARTLQPRAAEEGGPWEEDDDGGRGGGRRPASARAHDPRRATPYDNGDERLMPLPTKLGPDGLGAEQMLAWQFLPRHGLARYRAFGGMSSYFVRPPRHNYSLSRGGFGGGNGSKVWSRNPPGAGDKSIVR